MVDHVRNEFGRRRDASRLVQPLLEFNLYALTVPAIALVPRAMRLAQGRQGPELPS